MKDTWADRQLYSRIRIVQLRAGFLRIYESVSWEFGHKCEDLMSYGSFTFSLLAPILLFAMDELVSCHLTDVVGGRGSTAGPSLCLGSSRGNWFEQQTNKHPLNKQINKHPSNKQQKEWTHHFLLEVCLVSFVEEPLVSGLSMWFWWDWKTNIKTDKL